MAEETISRYESNYIKIAMVVLRVSPRAVRVQFDKEFHPNCLQRTLKNEWCRLSDLQTKKRITQPQWNLLFPGTGRLLYLFCLSQFVYVMVLSTAWFLVDGSLLIFMPPRQRVILIYLCSSVCPSGYRYMVCLAISSYSFGTTALIFCRMFINIMEVCMSTWF
jgi:hypothetical protein